MNSLQKALGALLVAVCVALTVLCVLSGLLLRELKRLSTAPPPLVISKLPAARIVWKHQTISGRWYGTGTFLKMDADDQKEFNLPERENGRTDRIMDAMAKQGWEFVTVLADDPRTLADGSRQVRLLFRMPAN